MNTPALYVAGSGSGPGIMGAARGHRFGPPPEAIAIEDMPLPAPGKGEVLVRVEAAGVRPWDGWVDTGREERSSPALAACAWVGPVGRRRGDRQGRAGIRGR